MTGVHGGDPPVKGSAGRRIALAAASGIDHLITRLCRFIVLVTGIALTVILTGNVVARYVLASGGIGVAPSWQTYAALGIVTGGGVSPQVAYWSGATTLAGDAGMTYSAANDTLTIDPRLGRRGPDRHDRSQPAAGPAFAALPAQGHVRQPVARSGRAVPGNHADDAQALIERLDAWLSRHDRDVNPLVNGEGRKRAGIGIYYFEEDLDRHRE